MKKSIFSLAFLLSIMIVSCNDINAQSISTFFNLKFSEETIGNDSKEGSAINFLDSDDKKSALSREEDVEVRKADKTNVQPSSSRISIGLGKVLFEKYIK